MFTLGIGVSSRTPAQLSHRSITAGCFLFMMSSETPPLAAVKCFVFVDFDSLAIVMSVFMVFS